MQKRSEPPHNAKHCSSAKINVVGLWQLAIMSSAENYNYIHNKQWHNLCAKCHLCMHDSLAENNLHHHSAIQQWGAIAEQVYCSRDDVGGVVEWEAAKILPADDLRSSRIPVRLWPQHISSECTSSGNVWRHSLRLKSFQISGSRRSLFAIIKSIIH